MQFTERRQSFRKHIPVFMEAFEETYPIGVLQNFSEEGVFIQSSDPKEVGTKINLCLQLPQQDDMIQLLAEVVWINHPSFLLKDESDGQYQTRRVVALNPGMGCRILSVQHQEDLEILKNYMEGRGL